MGNGAHEHIRDGEGAPRGRARNIFTNPASRFHLWLFEIGEYFSVLSHGVSWNIQEIS